MNQPLLIPILWNARPEGRQPKYRERYQYFREWDYEYRGIRRRVAEGTVIDGASVPRIAWWFLPPDGLHRRGAGAHDDVYGYAGIFPDGPKVSRAWADRMLYDFMVEDGVERWRAAITYGFVRAFGWWAWQHSLGKPIVLPVRQAARTIHKITKNPFRRHIYSAPLLTP